MNIRISQLDKEIIRAVQGELPLVERPYQKIADELEISKEELLARLKQLKEEGRLRRMGVILYHRQAGYQFNGMGAWLVSPERREEVGKLMTSYEEISHVYQRPTYPDWPYSLFSMIHGQSQSEVEEIAQEISEKTGIAEYKILYSTEELKKTSMKYFCEE
ncbi:Lrp/AsnC family transcriptional regulator [Natroniella acetigena]|uniref:siroheme decarboxylase subunit beta n=1 Tax=Natroniella acetigena TaxID=52004 RepID=UPI00200A1460|nr:Lrp/AsnC family transcriptional regulator [Natroniella acetigena]MCK8826138.1 Lrp/AsnC family transcriptional regulator [Natroniella acetigena]